MIQREEGAAPQDFKILCDGDNCDVVAPPSEEIMAGNGLNNMEWQCLGGTHLCPACKPQL